MGGKLEFTGSGRISTDINKVVAVPNTPDRIVSTLARRLHATIAQRFCEGLVLRNLRAAEGVGDRSEGSLCLFESVAHRHTKVDNRQNIVMARGGGVRAGVDLNAGFRLGRCATTLGRDFWSPPARCYVIWALANKRPANQSRRMQSFIGFLVVGVWH